MALMVRNGACFDSKNLHCDGTSGGVHCVDDKDGKAGSRLINEYRLTEDTTWLSIDSMVTDPENRDGECVKIADVLTKAEGIEAQGFDWGKVRVVAVQMPLQEDKRAKIFDTNTTWRAEDARFPSFDSSIVEVSLIGGNHLVTFLKMLKQAIRCQSFISTAPKCGSHRP